MVTGEIGTRSGNQGGELGEKLQHRRKMNLSAIPSMDAITHDYERLRESVLSSRPSPGYRPGLQRLVREGLHAWVLSRTHSLVRHSLAIPTTSATSAEPDDRNAMVQLLASMILRPLMEQAYDARR